ncbi:fumarate reductase subunit FrdD [Candidatus Providencia siddallii]
MNLNYKRSNEPIFWLLFSFGGMWSSLISPIIIILVGFLIPFDLIPKLSCYERNLIFCKSIIGSFFIFFMIVLPIWCGMHRIYHTLNDIKFYIPRSKIIFYGITIIVNVIAFFSLFIL